MNKVKNSYALGRHIISVFPNILVIFPETLPWEKNQGWTS